MSESEPAIVDPGHEDRKPPLLSGIDRRIGRVVLLLQDGTPAEQAPGPSPPTEGGDTQGLVGESDTDQPEHGEA